MMRAMPASLRMTVAAMSCVGVIGCRKAPPPPPPPAPPATSEPTAQEPEVPAPVAAPDPATEVKQPQRPEIPDHPASGQIDGRDFEVGSVTHLDATVLILGVDGRAVTLAVFGSFGPFEILDEPGFGAPHVYVRSPHDAPAKGYVAGYRLIYDEGEGLLWLQLPDDRGTIAGRFKVE